MFNWVVDITTFYCYTTITVWFTNCSVFFRLPQALATSFFFFFVGNLIFVDSPRLIVFFNVAPTFKRKIHTTTTTITAKALVRRPAADRSFYLDYLLQTDWIPSECTIFYRHWSTSCVHRFTVRTKFVNVRSMQKVYATDRDRRSVMPCDCGYMAKWSITPKKKYVPSIGHRNESFRWLSITKSIDKLAVHFTFA